MGGANGQCRALAARIFVARIALRRQSSRIPDKRPADHFLIAWNPAPPVRFEVT
jgi:hypothetical protein